MVIWATNDEATETNIMSSSPPEWALEQATADSFERVRSAHEKERLQIAWPERKALRAWAKGHGWRAPRFGFDGAFLRQMLDKEANFKLALRQSGIALQIPRREHLLSGAEIAKLDALYQERGDDGRPSDWGWLVGELREIRRAVEAGVVVQIEDGPALRSWNGFYRWAHGRYPMLEDGYDDWIGDDQ
jgi:hypothetical protein